MHIGKRIRNVMKQRKVPTAAMALYCGVTPGAVSNWFSTGRISKLNLSKAAAMLEVRMEDLIAGTIGEREDEVLPPMAVETGIDSNKLEPAERDLVRDFRDTSAADRKEIIQFVADRAARWRTLRAEFMASLEAEPAKAGPQPAPGSAPADNVTRLEDAKPATDEVGGIRKTQEQKRRMNTSRRRNQGK